MSQPPHFEPDLPDEKSVSDNGFMDTEANTGVSPIRDEVIDLNATAAADSVMQAEATSAEAAKTDGRGGRHAAYPVPAQSEHRENGSDTTVRPEDLQLDDTPIYAAAHQASGIEPEDVIPADAQTSTFATEMSTPTETEAGGDSEMSVANGELTDTDMSVNQSEIPVNETEAPSREATTLGAQALAEIPATEPSAADAVATETEIPVNATETEAEDFDVTALPGGLRGAVEAVLMVVDDPIDVVTLASAVGAPEEDVRGTLLELSAEYTATDRGFDLREVAGGWRIYSRADYAGVVERFMLDGQTAKITQAALETLAIVAYRQPVSRARVGAIRGVNVDAVMRTLVTRGLVAEQGTDPATGAVLYGTTTYFLQRLGIRSVDDLPPLAPYLPDMDEVDDIATGDVV